MTASALGSNGPPGSTCSLTIPFSVRDSKGWIPKGTVFTVKLIPLNNAPLPEKTYYEINVEGEYAFGEIVFDEPGDYEYTISELAYDDEKIIFDQTVYRVNAVIIYNDDGYLVGGYSLSTGGGTGKPTEVDFFNDYISPPEESSNTDNSSRTDSTPDESSSQASSLTDSSSSGSENGDSSTSSGNSSTASDNSDSSSSSKPSTGGGFNPHTGTAAVGFTTTAIAVPMLLMFIASRRRRDSEDEPPDSETG